MFSGQGKKMNNDELKLKIAIALLFMVSFIGLIITIVSVIIGSCN